MTKNPLEIFQGLDKEHRLIKQEMGKDTCLAVVYLNLSIYLGKNPIYSAEEVKKMFDSGTISWEEGIFSRLAGQGNVLKSHKGNSYVEWLPKLSRLINQERIPVGVSIKINGNFHAIIALQFNENESMLNVHDPLRGFVDLKVTENNLYCTKTKENFSYHHEFHIYYPSHKLDDIGINK